ncbi:MAG: hypothetical protein V4463_07170, partial [Pseudomonadota bacterium]
MIEPLPPLPWGKSSALPTRDAKPHSLRGMAPGTSIVLKDGIHFLTSLGNDKAIWKEAQPKLDEKHKVKAHIGDTSGGFIALLDDGKTIIQQVVGDKPEWKHLPAPLPFETVDLIAGDKNGMVIFNKAEGRLARSSGDCCSWVSLGSVPIDVTMLTGDLAKNFVAYGESMLYSVKVGKDTAQWTPLGKPNFGIKALSGNLADGVVALIGDGSVAAYCANLDKPSWVILVGPEVPADAHASEGKKK